MRRVDCKNYSDSGININMIDICNMLTYNGRVSGYSNIVKSEDLRSDVLKNINIDDMMNAKGISIIFGMHPDFPFSKLTDFMDEFLKHISSECEVVFGNITDTNLPLNKIDYKIIIAGL